MSKVAAVKVAAVKAKNTLERESEESTTKLLGGVKHYGRQIWLAGLGAYFKVGQEGLEYLKELIKTGEGVEKQGKTFVAQQVEVANEELESVKNDLSSVKGKVELQIDKIEQAFDGRVARGLNRIGIPSRNDLDALSAKLDVLHAMLERAAKSQ